MTTVTFDPRCVNLLVWRETGAKDWADGCLPLTGSGYRTIYGPGRKIALVQFDVVDYLRRHLGDFRDGWPSWLEEEGSSDGWFGPDLEHVDGPVAVYLGVWLHHRVLADALAEHGGTPEQYVVHVPWGLTMADAVIPQVIGGDPTVPLPVDHPLAQVVGQQQLIDGGGSGR